MGRQETAKPFSRAGGETVEGKLEINFAGKGAVCFYWAADSYLTPSPPNEGGQHFPQPWAAQPRQVSCHVG